ncbi:MAG: secretion activator protein [Rhodopseudomonas sp.]|nr:secretion activator protein [Rhodopseudomonas sp.]
MVILTEQERCNGAVKRVLLHEGGYTNHPADPGGPTNFGITIYDYRKYVKPGATADDVRAMQVEEAIRIYRAKYWDAMRCGELEPGVGYAAFDYGINSGIGRSGVVLRRIAHLPDNTSRVTDEVIAAVNALPAVEVVRALCDERLRFLESLRTWSVFGKGWERRVREVKTYGISIASDLPVIGSGSIVPAPGRAIDPDKFSRIRALQQQLADSGFDPGAIDGDLGPKTVEAFQRAGGLKVDGIIGPQTRPLLDAALAAAKPVAPAE